MVSGVLPSEVQLIGLRAPDKTHHFSVSIVVHARPEHWMLRRASLANLRATQEFKATYNDSVGLSTSTTWLLKQHQTTDHDGCMNGCCREEMLPG
eukprot:COSAG05_NODE_494_length_9271_cov_4.390536_3_plen_95_part_00